MDECDYCTAELADGIEVDVCANCLRDMVQAFEQRANESLDDWLDEPPEREEP